MKVLILGDIHGRDIWKPIIEKEKSNLTHIVFMGDYFDSFDISGIEQLHNFNKIIKFKEESDINITMLIGNHDHHYLIPSEIYSGYQSAMQWDFNSALTKNKHHLQIGYCLNNYLFTHAGISPIWMDNNFDVWSKSEAIELINQLYLYQPQKFKFYSNDFGGYGDDIHQSPLWIREKSLIKSNKGDDGFKKSYIQIVGHTQQEDIFKSFTVTKKSRGNRYYYVDTLDSGGYVVLENDILYPKTILT